MLTKSQIILQINEVFSDFVHDYPMCEEYREEILDITAYRVLKSQKTIDNYVLAPQVRVDIIVELTKLAMLIQGYRNYNVIPRKSEKRSYQRYFTYDKTGKVIFTAITDPNCKMNTDISG
ncbi:hypothetical protein [Desulfosporosinus youngiae]|uniref:Uncharacterized protein n=1 Tax=Desulfosporosinus youngiae DSM 17734 TaxID=768710 RepID=H5XUF1_9FIRM|nr:hypothetical protein [Desulfosporosinus youngiae]EHQ89387.1 hypothetical protein DesyoDRAFT_2304 [Desulfosporosinus youngiae DSM 17734]